MGRRKTRAVTLMLLSSLSFSIMQVFVKMSSTEVGTFEQVFFRNLISMIIAGVTVYRAKLDLIPEIKKGGLALWGRSFFGFLGIVLFFYATGHARQADVAMLNRASPIFVTIFAGPILKEKVSKVQVCAVALCLVGAYISMQPSFDSAAAAVRPGRGHGGGPGLYAAVLHKAVHQRTGDHFPFFPPEHGLRGTSDDPRICAALSQGDGDAADGGPVCRRGTVSPDLRLSAGSGL